VTRVEARDLNVVLQRPTLGPEDRFDLVIATNVLVYYDVFEQSLALLNIASMTRPGGFLLSNNAVLELPRSPMRSAGYRTTIYSDRENDGDHIVWYRRLIE
jgi:chemotaxis methyl-accepting protein methylase